MTATVVRRAQPWLGTLVSIDVVAGARRAEPAFASAFAAVERVHRAMSPQISGSDIARFNRARKGAVIACDPWTIRVLTMAQHLRAASGGLFDVALGTAGTAAYEVVGRHMVVKLAATARIDLGGIAKGYAVDRAICALRAGGAPAALVNAGGDLRAFGSRAWPIAVRAFAGAARTEFAVMLERGGMATSEYRHGRSPFHNDALVDPATGALHRVGLTVTVAAARCATADALGKIVALSGDARHPLVQILGARAWLH